MSRNNLRLPQEFLLRLKEQLPSQYYSSVLHSFTIRKPTTLRANTLKITAAQLRKNLADEGIKADTIHWYSDAFTLKNITLRQLQETKWYKDGYLYVQSFSSMIPALVLAPQPGEKILDITAAPGSKTTQMAMMMGNTGEIVANDISRVRLFKLEANLKIQGVTNVKVVSLPAQRVWRQYPEYFDKTLVDVPCSMEGRFDAHEPKSYAGWSVKKVKSLAKDQKWILRSAVSATKPGGTIVYSTCTISPEENEGVIDWILNKEKGSVKVESIIFSGVKSVQGIEKWYEETYSPEVKKTVRILPSATMEGFFVAKLKKIKSTVKQQVQSYST